MNLLKYLRFTFLALLVSGGVLSPARAGAFRTVVIDPGHGGHDNGGVWGKVYEKHLCLDTAARLEAYLHAMGFKTVMTRRSDVFVSLANRVKISNNTGNSIFVALHFNYTGKVDVSGLETFYYTPQSAKLCNLVHQGLMKQLRGHDRGVKTAHYYVIAHTTRPSILVEGGFVSSQTERDAMKSAWYRDKLARGIADGIKAFNN